MNTIIRKKPRVKTFKCIEFGWNLNFDLNFLFLCVKFFLKERSCMVEVEASKETSLMHDKGWNEQKGFKSARREASFGSAKVT